MMMMLVLLFYILNLLGIGSAKRICSDPIFGGEGFFP